MCHDYLTSKSDKTLILFVYVYLTIDLTQFKSQTSVIVTTFCFIFILDCISFSVRIREQYYHSCYFHSFLFVLFKLTVLTSLRQKEDSVKLLYTSIPYRKKIQIQLQCLLNTTTDKHFLLYTIIFCQIRTKLSIAIPIENEKERERERASVALIIHPIDYRLS